MIGRQWVRAHLPKTALGALEGLLVLGAILLVVFLGRKLSIYPEESYIHLAKAKSLLAGRGFEVPWNDGADGHFRWGYPLLLSIPLKLFGEAGIGLLAATLTFWCAFVFSRTLRLFEMSQPARVVAMGLMLFNPVTLRWAAVPVPDLLLLASSITAIFFGFRFNRGASIREFLWGGLFAGFAVFTQREGFFTALTLLGFAAPRLWRERRWGWALVGVALLLLPEGTRQLWAWMRDVVLFAPSDHLSMSQPVRDAGLWSAIFGHLRAPFWMVFRFSAARWLYDRYFSAGLAVAHGIGAMVYLAMLAFALISGFFRMRARFVAAAMMLAAVILHTLFWGRSERLDLLLIPLAAVVFAGGFEALAATLEEAKLRTGLVLGLGLAVGVVSGFYGTRTAQMQAEWLAMSPGGAGCGRLAEQINEANPDDLPVASDFGSCVAFYTRGWTYFGNEASGLHDDFIPEGEKGHAFLDEKKVEVIASRLTERELRGVLKLEEDEFDSVPASRATLLVRNHPNADGDDGSGEDTGAPDEKARQDSRASGVPPG